MDRDETIKSIRTALKRLEAPLFLGEVIGGCPALALMGGHFTHRNFVLGSDFMSSRISSHRTNRLKASGSNP